MHWFRRANGWTIHVNLVHVLATYTVSKLGGLARSPSKLAVKEMKHLLCWFYDNRDKGITFGGKDSTGVNALTPKELAQFFLAANPPPYCLFFLVDSDLKDKSRYSVWLYLNGGPIKVISRMQHSIASDITDSEAFGFGIAAVLCEVVRGRLDDMGASYCTIHATGIGTDNDATRRIAADAASAKRAQHIMRRLGHTRHLTDLGVIVAKKIARDFNVADAGTHYCTKDVLHAFDKKLRNA